MKTIGLITANYTNSKFGPLTEQRPLASLPFAGRYRLLDFVLSNMVNSGITKVGIITPFNSGSVIDHVGSGKPWSLDRKKDGIFLMPGSVYGVHKDDSKFLFKDFTDNRAYVERSDVDYVIITASTHVYNMDYNDLINHHAASDNQITVMYKKIASNKDVMGVFVDTDSNGKVEGLRKVAKEGPDNLFMDCMIVNRDFMLDCIRWFEAIGHRDFIDIINDNIDKFSIGAYEFKGYLGKIDDINEYLKVCTDIADYDTRNEIFNSDRTVYTKVQDDAPVLFRGNGTGKNSIIGAGCKIEGIVENTSIFRSTTVGANAYLKNCVVMMYCEIGEGAVLENVICDKFVKIRPGVKLIGSPDKPIVIGKGLTV